MNLKPTVACITPCDNEIAILQHACNELPCTAIPRVIDDHIYQISGPRDGLTPELFRRLWDLGLENGDFKVSISIKRLAEMLETTETSIKRARMRLWESGLLRWNTPLREDGSNADTEWFIQIPLELQEKILSAKPSEQKLTRPLSPVSHNHR